MRLTFSYPPKANGDDTRTMIARRIGRLLIGLGLVWLALMFADAIYVVWALWTS